MPPSSLVTWFDFSGYARVAEWERRPWPAPGDVGHDAEGDQKYHRDEENEPPGSIADLTHPEAGVALGMVDADAFADGHGPVSTDCHAKVCFTDLATSRTELDRHESSRPSMLDVQHFGLYLRSTALVQG